MKHSERQIGDTRKAYLFGHYDSRGCASLVFADNHIEALRRYAESFVADDTKESIDQNIDNTQDDFLGRVEVVTCDEAIDYANEPDLDEDYGGKFRYGHVYERWRSERHPRWSRWRKTDLFVVWKGHTAPTLPVVNDHPSWDTTEYQRIVRREHLGEDAAGLVPMA